MRLRIIYRHHAVIHYTDSEDGGGAGLKNIGLYLCIDAAACPRRFECEYSIGYVGLNLTKLISCRI
jgi:hypothetical protein